MESIWVKLFIKNKNDINNVKVRTKYGTLASLFGIISNTIICVFKIIVGAITGIVSIVADGINNLSDALSSIVSLFGFKMSQKKPDKEHPYGHQRVEYIAGFIVSVIICILGVQLIISSIDKIRNPEAAQGHFILTIAVLVFAIFMKIYQAWINYSIGKKINSTSLKATAADSRNDVISTILVLVGVFISHFTKYNLDGYFGIAVGAFVCFSGIKLVFESSNPLIGEAPSKELVNKLIYTIKNHEVVLGVHDLEIHSYGPSKMFAVCHVEVDSRGDLIELHDEIDQIEHEVRNTMDIMLTIHMDPVLVGDKKTEELKVLVKEVLQKGLSFSWSMHDFRIVVGPTHTNVVFDLVVPYTVKQTEAELKELIEKLVNTYDNSLHTSIDIDYDLNDLLEEDRACEKIDF